MSVTTNYPNTKPSLLLDFANTKKLDPRVTFYRASTASYYDGVTFAKAEENLLANSQNFTSWSKSAGTISANSIAAPDSSSTATTLTAAAGAALHAIYQYPSQITLNSPCTFSVFLKQSTSCYAILYFYSGSNGNVWDAAVIDLSAGAITKTASGSLAGNFSASITAVGSGWYRASITVTPKYSGMAAMVSMCDSANPTLPSVGLYSFNATGSESIYVWGAQLEQRSQVTTYTPTTSAQIANYIPVLKTAPADVPRFDHSPITGESLGLLIEQQSTNLLWPSDGTGSFGNQQFLGLSPIVVPDGSVVSCLWDSQIGNTANRYQLTIPASRFASGSYVTLSWYQKRVNGRGGGSVLGIQNHVNATTSSQPAMISDAGNGWTRWSSTVTIADGGIETILRMYIANAADLVFNSFACWGIQIEAGAFPTSYIPTTSSQVTRAADNASMTGANFSSWYRQDEGTLFSLTSSFSGNSVIAQIDNGSHLGNRYLFDFSNTTTVRAYSEPSAAGATLPIPSTATLVRAALCYGGASLSISANGVVGATQSVQSPSAPSRLTLGNIGGSYQLNGTIKKFAYYPKKISATALQALTT